MKRLWAPWRMAYLRGEKRPVDGCVFCRKISADDVEEHVLFRGRRCFVMLNRYPYSNGHLLVVPYAHVGSLGLLDGDTLQELFQTVCRSQAALREASHPQGFNIGINEGHAAGAGIQEHIHVHIVPRWEGDANFLTVIGETRVLPELLSQTYELLRPVFATWSVE